MDTFILCIVIYCVGFFFGSVWQFKKLIRTFAQNPEALIEVAKKLKEIDQQGQDGIPENAIQLEIERVGNMLYAYAHDTHQFMGQAGDLNTLLESVHKRFPGKTFFGEIPADDPAKELVKQ